MGDRPIIPLRFPDEPPEPHGPKIVAGLRTIFVVLRCEHEGGTPQMLAAYDGEHAEKSAEALKALIELTYAPGQILVLPCPVWPLLKAEMP